ncbi:AraC family transcriptional regulator [Vibrio agarivorans]|uniref:AraC family transcriptional regulator n=1 Tax=Vibrio agarivorans TaxID=153622 RepID=A0ABT7Y606_9VIBR|nr:AraC family transcriptional regulator [Vibrio agarivorans]MDN2483488.1 AraC family transcriptional regulator [Vibrio agarivorans]
MTKSDRAVHTVETGQERIERVLSYIHNNISESISLEDIAKYSCWSRWQLQRVFQNQTGISVATYVRELKLSAAAERMLDTSDKLIDIAFDLGFNSEISFSRAFKQMFNLSPRAYRKAGVRTGLRKPLQYHSVKFKYGQQGSALADVRIETSNGFTVVGIQQQVNGLFSQQPDFNQRVPETWQRLAEKIDLSQHEHIGVFDLSCADDLQTTFTYWAAIPYQDYTKVDCPDGMEVLAIPAQTYVVVNHKGSIETLSSSLEWVLIHWLPNSGYRAIDGFELEHYPADYQVEEPESTSTMEYWIPIERE